MNARTTTSPDQKRAGIRRGELRLSQAPEKGPVLLQRTFGNQGVQRLLHSNALQTKHRKSTTPCLTCEDEQLVKRKTSTVTPLVQRKAPGEEELLQGEELPGTPSGDRLLAHELTHVVQQTGSDSPFARFSASIQGSGGNAAGDGQVMRTPDECLPAAGSPPTSCSPYLANSWWLPLAYVNNATCACSETPNEPTANCVRKFLQDRLAATPVWVKAAAALQKPQEVTNPPQYQAYVQAALTPRIYQDHVDAYRSCCCPSGPAPYPAWIGVTSVPMPCAAVGWSIRQFGSCHGTPGRW